VKRLIGKWGWLVCLEGGLKKRRRGPLAILLGAGGRQIETAKGQRVLTRVFWKKRTSSTKSALAEEGEKAKENNGRSSKLYNQTRKRQQP